MKGDNKTIVITSIIAVLIVHTSSYFLLGTIIPPNQLEITTIPILYSMLTLYLWFLIFRQIFNAIYIKILPKKVVPEVCNISSLTALIIILMIMRGATS